MNTSEQKEQKLIIDPKTAVMTCGIRELIESDVLLKGWVLACLLRHCEGDWGDLDEDDKKMNDEAVESGIDDILSAYKYPLDESIEIYVKTDYGWKTTTILFPWEW